MCGSRTVTTALEREAERARGRGREREGQGWRRRWEMRVEERGMWEDVVCVYVCVCVCVCVFVCIHMATRATRITTEGCSQLPRIPQRLASSILKPRGVFPESGNRLKRMREMKWQGHTHTLTHVRAHKLHDVLIMWVQQRSSCGDRRTWCVPSPAESLPHSCTLGCPYCICFDLSKQFSCETLALNEAVHLWEAPPNTSAISLAQTNGHGADARRSGSQNSIVENKRRVCVINQCPRGREDEGCCDSRRFMLTNASSISFSFWYSFRSKTHPREFSYLAPSRSRCAAIPAFFFVEGHFLFHVRVRRLINWAGGERSAILKPAIG